MTERADVRVLVTGATGFVGQYLMQALRGHGINALATTRAREAHHPDAIPLDVTDIQSIRAAVTEFKPTHIINLAGMAAPAEAEGSYRYTWDVHLSGALNLAEAILDIVPACWLVQVSTGLVYGASGKGGVALTETAALEPRDTYAASKAAAEFAVASFAARGLKSIRMRPFNHTGAGQTTDFVVPAFADQIARIEAGTLAPIIKVGNLDAKRDFLDVRDVANAYVHAVLSSDNLRPADIFNISSGKAVSIRSVLDKLLAKSDRKIEVNIDPARSRPSDFPVFVGDAERAIRQLGWSPKMSLDSTLEDVLNFFRVKHGLRAMQPNGCVS